jgi:integrase
VAGIWLYLSDQALDILVALKTCAGGSPYVFPSRYDGDQPISKATLNRVTGAVIEEALADGVPLAPFTPHDFRRTGSTALHEAGFQSDWIEKCLAHEQRGVRAVYNKAERFSRMTPCIRNYPFYPIRIKNYQ